MSQTRTGLQALSSGILVACAALGLIGSGCSTVRATSPQRKGFFAALKSGSAPRSPAGRFSAREAEGARVASGNHLANTTDAAHVTVKRLKPVVRNWVWPLKDVHVTSRFGQRGKDFHEGIDLKAKVGTPIYATESGKVIYSGSRISGYGRMIVLRHKNGLATIYAHASRLLVKLGQKVKRGQKIAISGATGRVRGPHLHFEIRDGVAAIDPLRLLPNSPAPPVLATQRRVRTVATRK